MLAPGMWPREKMRTNSSIAEAALYDALKRKLIPGWYGWHSLRIRTGIRLLGEGDFVLAHPDRGLLVIEVKGGQLELRDGRWFQNGRALEKSPLEQANEFLGKLLDKMSGCLPPAWGAAVCFPETSFDIPPTQDDLAEVLLGRRDLPYLDDALAAVIERALPPAQRRRNNWLSQLHDWWGETWIPHLALGHQVRDLDDCRHRLDDRQIEILDGIMANARILVDGPAGSGKTLLAAEAARRHAARGDRVLMLCFTRPLATYLQSRLAASGVEVHTISHLGMSLKSEIGGHMETISDQNEEFPRILLEAAELENIQRWDTIVVDEAQDLQDEGWIFVEALADGRRLWAFYDPGQQFWKDRKIPTELFRATFSLTTGRRCPPGILALAARYGGAACDNAAIDAVLKNGSLRIVECPSASSVPDKIGQEVDRLLSEHVALSDIAIVSLRGQSGSALHACAQVGRHPFVRADAPDMGERLVADSFLRWKGLERPAVIITDLPAGPLDQRDTRMVIALTRTQLVARIVAPRDCIQNDPILASLQ